MQFALSHWYVIAAVAGGAGLIAWQFWPSISKFWPSGSTQPATDDGADFAALSRLRKRFETRKCPEGLAACDVCLTHFFHGGGE